jgi:DNA-binding NarL/FixJ family response regulator
MKNIKIAIIDPTPLVGDSLKSVLNKENGIEISHVAKSAIELISLLNTDQNTIDLVLLNCASKSKDLIHKIEILKDFDSSLKLIVICKDMDADSIKKVWKKPVMGLVDDANGIEGIITAIQSFTKNSVFISESFSKQITPKKGQ